MVRERLFINRHRLWQIGTDAVLVSVALYLAFLLRFDFDVPARYVHLLRTVFIYVVIVKLATFLMSGLYNKWWRYSGMRDLASLLQASVVASALAVMAAELIAKYAQSPFFVHNREITATSLPRGVIFLDWMLAFLIMGGARLVARAFWERPWREDLSRDRKKVLVVGAGDAGELVVREMLKTRQIRYRPVAFVDDDPRKKNLRIHGVRVAGTTRRLPQLVEEYGAEEVVIAMPSVGGKVVEDIVMACKKVNVPVKTLPGVYELIKGSVTIEQLRDVQVEDILGRGEVEVDLQRLASYLQDAVVMVTGAGGSIGGELCRQIAAMAPRRLLLVDHSEGNLFEIHHELEWERHFGDAVPLVVDVKNKVKVDSVLAEYRPTIVFHAAAYKHVPMMEANPLEAFDNNTFATLTLAQSAMAHGVQRLVFISTDKAVEPETVMGLSKALGERIIEGLAQKSKTTKLISVRFGNVLGSSGSVVPIFKRQIAAGGPVTVTDERMTRYFMTIPEAVRLVLQAGAMGEGGEVFVLDMGQPMKIIDLARDMIRLSGFEPDRDIAIEVTGIRPGEKLHEKLFNDGEEVQTTAHPKILRAVRVPIPFARLQKALGALQVALREGDLQSAQRLGRSIADGTFGTDSQPSPAGAPSPRPAQSDPRTSDAFAARQPVVPGRAPAAGGASTARPAASS